MRVAFIIILNRYYTPLLWATKEINILNSQGIESGLIVPKHYGVDVAREIGVEAALEDGYTHIFFLDDDVLPERHGVVVEMLSLDYPVICGVYYQKNLKGLAVLRRAEHDYISLALDDVEDKLAPADACGLGFVLIDAEVFRRLSKPWFSLRPRGEDVYFFEKMKSEIGHRPVVYGRAKAYHLLTETLGLDWRKNVVVLLDSSATAT